jgi:hypothetical protein
MGAETTLETLCKQNVPQTLGITQRKNILMKNHVTQGKKAGN